MKQSFILFFVSFVFAACAQFTTTPPPHRSVTGYGFSTNPPSSLNSGFGFTTTAPRITGPADLDALRYCSRAGIVNPSERRIIDSLVKQLKAANLWTNFYAFYPMIGGTSNQCAINLVSTNYDITWYDGLPGTNRFFTNGVVGNGISFYGDTHFNPVAAGMIKSNMHMYAWLDSRATSIGVAMGADDLPNIFRQIQLGYRTNVAAYGTAYWTSADQLTEELLSLQDASYNGGNLLFTLLNTNSYLFSTNGVQRSVRFTNDCLPNTNWYVFAEHNGQNGGAIRYAGNGARAMSFGYGMTTNQATNFFAIMNRFQFYFSRANPTTR